MSLPAFGPTVVQSAERATSLEWLDANGLGDFACGTVAGPNTRREHGLFTAGPVREPRSMLLLASLSVALEREGERHELSCHQYVGARHPEGFRHCVEFRSRPFPEWRYEPPGAALTFRVFMPHGRRAVACAWTLDENSGRGDWRLTVRPLCAFRESGALTRANSNADLSLRGGGGAFSIRPYSSCPEMFFHCGPAEVRSAPDWYYRFQHPWDIALSREAEEDLFSPCELAFPLSRGQTVFLTAGLESEIADPDSLERDERARRMALGLPAMPDDPVARALAAAADAFVAKDAEGRTVILSAYPEPVRDARSELVSLPGLLLCTRRLGEAREFIGNALRRAVDSEAPAGLGDEWLWLIRAGEQYVDYSRDWEFLREELAPAAEALVGRYIENTTDSGFHLAPDGLLASQGAARSLTWMNAAVDGWPVTPRHGKPVEVNALWRHALSLLSRWARRRERPEVARRFDQLGDLCGRTFRHRFWNQAEGCLFDVLDPNDGEAVGASDALRPNQLLAMSLPSDLLERSQATSVLSFVEKRLLTPVGLRTLSLEDRAFRAHYGGGTIERAGAKHQGSVFPWLMGAYVDAVFRVHGRTPRAFARAEGALDTLLQEHLQEGCVGQVSELFHGSMPHKPQGAFAHAAALGEVIRAYTEIKGRLI